MTRLSLRSAAAAFIGVLLPVMATAIVGQVGEPPAEPLELTPGTPVPILVGGPGVTSTLYHDGVGQLFITHQSGMVFPCTGSLLDYDGPTAILTAGHCVSERTGPFAGLNAATHVEARFTRADGTELVYHQPDAETRIILDPDYNGFWLHGYDVAVIFLDETVDPSLPRYELTPNALLWPHYPLGSGHWRVGYGQTGDGQTGFMGEVGTKRFGINTYGYDPRTGTAGNLGTLGAPFIANAHTQYHYDFDNVLAAIENDGYHYFWPSLFNAGGLGDYEVSSSPGDSGGPVFAAGGNPYTWYIVAVTSYGYRVANGQDVSRSV